MAGNDALRLKYGPWALVTGASSGIGEEFSRQLAAAGFDLVIAARRLARLEALAEQLQAVHEVRVRPVRVDLTSPDRLSVLRAATDGLEIGLLINNAGAMVPGSFLKQDVGTQTGIIELNVTAPMQLAAHFAEGMRRRQRGGVIFTSSLAGYVGSPYLANYVAAKSYLLSLGVSLHHELKPQGVDVLVLSPGPTRTEMAEVDGLDFSKVPMNWMNADAVVGAALKGLGRRREVVPGGANRVMKLMMTRVLPRGAALGMFGNMMRKGMDPSIV